MNNIRSKVFGSLISAKPAFSLWTQNMRTRNLTNIGYIQNSVVLNTNVFNRNNVFMGNSLLVQNICCVNECKYYSKNENNCSVSSTLKNNDASIVITNNDARTLMIQDDVCDSLASGQEGSLPMSGEEGNWSSEMKWIMSQETKDVLCPPKDLSDIDGLTPDVRPSFNFAAYVNKSHMLQEMVKLGVDLSKWEKRKGIGSFILRLEFERDMKQHIVFLHDVGVAAEDLGQWLSINPMIFKETLDDLHARLNYLHLMNFTQNQITRIISRNPYWLLFSNIRIDNRLGYFQKSFDLTGAEVRSLAAKQPKLITLNLYNVQRTSFAVVEEMGFTAIEMKSLLLTKPKLWMAHGVSLLRRFNFAHNEMGLSHSQLVQFPHVLLSREFRLKQRHEYLKTIGRNQYNPLQPNYVSPSALVAGDDAEFCNTIAKTSVQDFNDFLKTM
ncbi:transcription termination factor 3, mitochondrial [Procambarus clarkii]|uniref:transcription termination factor 3, mitochondrial n=1 Tax=Procambarus clarkii TaxID=6728 RepID=UPI0037448631